MKRGEVKNYDSIKKVRSQENKRKTEIGLESKKNTNIKIKMGRREGTKQKTEGR